VIGGRFRILRVERQVGILVTNACLDFGTKVQIFYSGYNGRRRKAVLVMIIAD